MGTLRRIGPTCAVLALAALGLTGVSAGRLASSPLPTAEPGPTRFERLAPSVHPSTQRVESPPASRAQPLTQEPRFTAVDERDERVRELRASGPDIHRLFVDAEAMGRAWSEIAQKARVKAVFGEWECHELGCFASVVHKGASGVEVLAHFISISDAFRLWTGGKFQSGPIQRADGSVEMTWILYSPRGRDDVMSEASD